MDVLILAAGRGERMRPLTDRTPKPLLRAGGTTLIERQIDRLVSGGHDRLVINLAHLGAEIEATLGDGSRYGASITYSHEPPGALDTGGGIVQALEHLRGECFAVVNADIWTDFPYREMPSTIRGAAWLVLVENPPHNPRGDFGLHQGVVRPARTPDRHTLTFAGIGVYRRSLFDGCAPGRYPLLPILSAAVARGDVEGLCYRGTWTDVGTPGRLEALRSAVAGP